YGAPTGAPDRPRMFPPRDSRVNRWPKVAFLPPVGSPQFFSIGSERRNDFISARLSNCLNAPEVIATRKDRTGWDFKRPIERKHPACAMRGERNPLANCIVAE